MQILAKIYTSLSLQHIGYIAGSGDGIVTVKGRPSSRKIWLMSAKTMLIEQVITSLKNGHYMFSGLDLTKEYLVIVRDFKRELEPFAWDFVKPTDDLTVIEQQELWQTWQ